VYCLFADISSQFWPGYSCFKPATSTRTCIVPPPISAHVERKSVVEAGSDRMSASLGHCQYSCRIHGGITGCWNPSVWPRTCITQKCTFSMKTRLNPIFSYCQCKSIAMLFIYLFCFWQWDKIKIILHSLKLRSYAEPSVYTISFNILIVIHFSPISHNIFLNPKMVCLISFFNYYDTISENTWGMNENYIL